MSGRRYGYSIVEILLAMAILTSLIVSAIVVGKSIKTKARISQLLKDSEAISMAMAAFNDDLGVWPRDKEGIKDLIVKPQNLNNYQGLYLEDSRWRGPYIKLPVNDSGYPVNPLRGHYFVRNDCSQDLNNDGESDCEYGVIITKVPRKIAEDLDARIDGLRDPDLGTCLYGEKYDRYEEPGEGRVNIFIRAWVDQTLRPD